MNRDGFNNIKSKALLFKYSSFMYIEFENIVDYDLQVNTTELILMLGYNREAKSYEYIWATNDVNVLINTLKCKESFFLSFIPREWIKKFKNSGLRIRNAWHDYFIYNLDSIDLANEDGFDYLALSEINEASHITMECKGQSRGFTGQTSEWFREWLNSNSEIKNTAILVKRTPAGVLCGILYVGIYGHKSKDGPTVWIKEVAVKPEYQNSGVARKLITQGLKYGREKGAKKAFLAVDEDNINAIHLYTSLGFMASKDDSEITMTKD